MTTMFKAAYQRLVGYSSSSGGGAPPDYGSTLLPPPPTNKQEEKDDDNIIPGSIRVRSSLSSSSNRRQHSWKLIRNSIISIRTNSIILHNRHHHDDNDDEEGDTTVPDFIDIAESVFSDIRSESAASQLAISNEATEYSLCTAYQRAFPERSFALFVTLIFELPTLFMISGGSDRLCGLIGRNKYTALISLLPIISAVSGNVGLQASTLTTRAISHSQVCVDNYMAWLKKEITAAMYLGCAMGFLSSSIAFCMGGFHVPFALSIFIAQWIGIFTAGLTGTLAPLIFTFICERDSGKWAGPLETAVQDVVGSFAMIVVTYWIMNLFGPYDIEPTDMC
jgi:hypothetical protein